MCHDIPRDISSQNVPEYMVRYLETEDEHTVLYHQVLNHVQFKRNLQVVVVVNTRSNRYVVLFSTDVALARIIHHPEKSAG